MLCTGISIPSFSLGPRPKPTPARIASASSGLGLGPRLTFLVLCTHLAVSRFVLGKRMGCLSDEVPQDCQELIDTLQELLLSTQRLMTRLPVHIVWSTKEWKFLKQKMKILYDLSLRHVKEKLEEIREEEHGRALEGSEAPDKVDLLTYLVLSGKQSLEEAATNAIDLITAGIDTVSYFVQSFHTGP